MPRTRVFGKDNADVLVKKVKSQGGRRVRIRAMLGADGEKSEWFLVTWNRPEPFNINHHLWWMLGLVIAWALWRINV